MSKKVAFLGLGVMGYPMAGYLVKNGYEVTVYNRSPAKAEQWVAEFGGACGATPKAAAQDAEIVFACVGADDDIRQIAYGDDGLFAGLAPAGIFVDHTTASATVAREIQEYAADNGFGFVDAPVSGGQAGAENGVLTVMCGGDQANYDKVKDAIDCYARMCQLMGPAGSGQLTKMVNQICISGLVQALSEGINFATNAGLDGAQVIDVISKGAAQSWQMENRYQTMLAGEFDHGFAVEWMRKDLGICLAEAKNMGISLPVAGLVDQFYAEVEAIGGKRWDTSSLLARLQHYRK
jgi:3-hydroxyisobutyrate dehydrogenase